MIVAAHFKNAFRGAGHYMATIDGLWQLSDNPTNVSENTKYDKMTIQTVTADSIILNNEDNDITLGNNVDISLVPGINIKVAGADELRYYIYKDITEPGTYEIRSNVATESATWTADDFAGFYFDFDDDFKTEELAATVIDGKLLEPDGIIYSTAAERNGFGYSDWGYYNAIGFMGEKYFAGYIEGDSVGTNPDLLADADNVNLLDLGLLTEILIDKSQETVQDLSSPIELEEGYSLELTVGSDKNGILAELFKDKKLVDKKAVLLPGTYVYTSSQGNAAGIPLIAAYFQEPIFLESKTCFKINGLWQISENPIQVREGDHYGIMTVPGLIQPIVLSPLTMRTMMSLSAMTWLSPSWMGYLSRLLIPVRMKVMCSGIIYIEKSMSVIRWKMSLQEVRHEANDLSSDLHPSSCSIRCLGYKRQHLSC